MRSSIETFHQLADNGIIGPMEEEERKRHNILPPLIRIIVSNTSACNLACRYCYNRFEDTKDSFESRLSLSEENIRAALIALGRLSCAATDLEILFIGGEPLLRFDLIQYAAKVRATLPELAGKKVRLFLITNGTLLDRDIMDFCSSQNIHIKLSIDGNRERHDMNRLFPDRRGTYVDIFSRLPDYFYHYTHPSKAVTATVDSFGDDLVPTVEHLVSLGFMQIELTELYGCSEDISMPPDASAKAGKVPGNSAVDGEISGISTSAEVESESCEEPLSDEEKERLERNYSALTQLIYLKIRSRKYLHLIPFYDPLYFLHSRFKKVYPCRTGFDSVALFADGVFYPCHHYMGDVAFSLGDLAAGLSREKLNSLRRPVYDREQCRECWGRFLCGGECYHRAMVEGDDMYGRYERSCYRKKVLFREVIYLYHRLKEEDPEALKWYFSVNLYP
ncbi:MAG: radical SAM protein [Candidatus Xenobiia bacterium LiM19]